MAFGVSPLHRRTVSPKRTPAVVGMKSLVPPTVVTTLAPFGGIALVHTPAELTSPTGVFSVSVLVEIDEI